MGWPIRLHSSAIALSVGSTLLISLSTPPFMLTCIYADVRACHYNNRPNGTVIRAVGNALDHEVAGAAL